MPGVGEEVGGGTSAGRGGVRRFPEGCSVLASCVGTGHSPLAGFRVGEVEYLRFVGAAAYDDLDAAVVLGRHGDGAYFGNEHPAGVEGVADQDAGGELLAHLRATDRAGGGGLGNQEHVQADLAAHVIERGPGQEDSEGVRRP